MKAGQLCYYESMVELENGRFFSGPIGLLFDMLSSNLVGSQDILNMENVKAYSQSLLTLFDGKPGGCAAAFDDQKHLLRRALMTFHPYYYGMEKNSNWCFCGGLDEWREYVNTKNEGRNALYALLKEVLVPAQKQGRSLRQVAFDYVEAISRDYENQLLISDDHSFRYHFIHHPGMWDYMETKRCMWTDNYNIVLKKSSGNNSNRMELRTLGLYLDYCHHEDFKCDCTGWRVDLWARGKSCMFFERAIPFGKKELRVAIDVYFFDHQGNRTCEDNYGFDLFLRSKHAPPVSQEEERTLAEESYQVNMQLFSQLYPELITILERKNDGRLCSKMLYNRRGIKEVLKQIMQGVNHLVTIKTLSFEKINDSWLYEK